MGRIEKCKFYPWVVVGLLWVVALLNYMDRQMLSTMRDSMQIDIADLESAVNFGRLMAVFLWIYGLMSPVAGAVADRISRKWLIVGSLGVWSTVTLLMGYSSTFSQIYWLRALMGVSEALYIPAGLSLIADYFTGSARSLAIGIHMTGLYVGQAVGGFGATVASAFSWQTTFHWFGIIGIVYAFVLILFLHDKRREPSVDNLSDLAQFCLDLLECRLLGHPLLFRIILSSRLGDEELASDSICRKLEYPNVTSWANLNIHHCVFFFHRSDDWRPNFRPLGETQSARSHLCQRIGYGPDDSCLGSDRFGE